jgi:hypothetical protein
MTKGRAVLPRPSSHTRSSPDFSPGDRKCGWRGLRRRLGKAVDSWHNCVVEA